MVDELLFQLLGAVAVISALAVVLFRSPIYSVLSLIVCFFCVSGTYLLLHATFLAIVNIIVYAGAIMVLFLFVIMLLNLNKASEGSKPLPFRLAGIGISVIIFFILLAAVARMHGPVMTGPMMDGSLKAISKILFGEYMLAFELSSVLFLTAIVGVVLLSRKEPDGEEAR